MTGAGIVCTIRTVPPSVACSKRSVSFPGLPGRLSQCLHARQPRPLGYRLRKRKEVLLQVATDRVLKNATVKLSMTPLEKELLQGIAARAGVSISELVRLVIVYQTIELPEPPSGELGKIDKLDERCEQIRIQLTASEKECIKERAQSLGCSMSDLVRRTAITGKVVKQNDFDVEAVRKVKHELLKQGTNLNQLMYFLNRNGIGALDPSEVKQTMWSVRDAVRKAEDLIDKLTDEC